MNCFMVWLTDQRCLALFPAGTIVRDPYHRESLIRREQGFNLGRTCVVKLWSKVWSRIIEHIFWRTVSVPLYCRSIKSLFIYSLVESLLIYKKKKYFLTLIAFMEGKSLSLLYLYLCIALYIVQSELKPFFPLILNIETKTVSQRCSVKKVFIKVLQNSQEDNCARVSGPVF